MYGDSTLGKTLSVTFSDMAGVILKTKGSIQKI